MASVLASVSVVLGADISAFRAAMAQARRELRGLVQAGEAMKDIGKGLTTYVTAPLVALGAGAVAASGKIESLRNALASISTQDLARPGTTGIAALGEAASLTRERMKELEVLARQPGLGFEQAVQGDVRLRAVGISAEQSAKSLKAFANAIATTGGGKSEFDRVTVQLAQLSAKGKVLAQDLRPIIEAAPAVSAALQKLYGTVDSEEISKQLKKQGQSSTDFIAVLTDELGKIPQVASGLKNGLENLGDTLTISLAKIGDGISKALNLPAVLAGISDFVTRIGDAFATLSPGAQRLAVGLAVAAAAAGPLLLGFGALLTALPSMVAGFGILTGAVSLSLGPIALGAAAIAAAAYLIIDNWSAITAYFAPSGEGGRIFKDLAASVTDSVGVIAGAFASLGSGDNLGGLVSASGVIKGLFQDIAIGVTAFSDVFGGAIGAVIKLLRGDFAGAADEAKRALFGLIDPLANVLGFSKAQKSSTIQDFFKLRDVLIEIDVAAGNASLRGGDLAAALGRVGATTGLLAGLREQLKAVKEVLDTEATEKAIAADNRRIESLEKQIDRLEKLGRSSKALAELQKALTQAGTLRNIFAVPAEGAQRAQERMELLTTGIKNLVQEGIVGAGTIARFGNELLRLQQQTNSSQFAPIDPLGVPDVKLVRTYGDKLRQQLGALADSLRNTPAFNQPIEIPLVLQKVKTDFGADLLNANIALGKLFSQNAGLAITFGQGFNQAGADADALRGKLQELIAQGINPLDPAFQKLAGEYNLAERAATSYAASLAASQQASQTLQQGIISLASGVADAFGAALAGTTSFGDALTATLLSTVGSVASQLGSILLASGLGIEALKVSLGTFSGAGAIAAGLGLLAIGGLAKAGAASLSGGGSTRSVGAGGNLGQSANAGQNAAPLKILVEVTGTLRGAGKDLVAVLSAQDYRRLRTS